LNGRVQVNLGGGGGNNSFPGEGSLNPLRGGGEFYKRG